MSSFVELHPAPLGAGQSLRVTLPDAAARAIGTVPGDRWLDDLVTALLEVRPEGFRKFLAALDECLATATVTFVVPSKFEGDQPLEIVRWAEAPVPDRLKREPMQPPLSSGSAPASSSGRCDGGIRPLAARGLARQEEPPPAALGSSISMRKQSMDMPSAAIGSRRAS